MDPYICESRLYYYSPVYRRSTDCLYCLQPSVQSGSHVVTGPLSGTVAPEIKKHKLFGQKYNTTTRGATINTSSRPLKSLEPSQHIGILFTQITDI